MFRSKLGLGFLSVSSPSLDERLPATALLAITRMYSSSFFIRIAGCWPASLYRYCVERACLQLDRGHHRRILGVDQGIDTGPGNNRWASGPLCAFAGVHMEHLVVWRTLVGQHLCSGSIDRDWRYHHAARRARDIVCDA